VEHFFVLHINGHYLPSLAWFATQVKKFKKFVVIPEFLGDEPPIVFAIH
jgi:hypothetical protein